MRSDPALKVPDMANATTLPIAVHGANIDTERARSNDHTKESTWRDIYHSEAKKVDRELIHNWKENLNGILLFVSSF